MIGAAVFGAYVLGGGSLMVSLFAIAGRHRTADHVGADQAMDTRPDLRQRPGHRGDVRRRTPTAPGAQRPDAVGNTTKAITGDRDRHRGARRTALFGSYRQIVEDAIREAGSTLAFDELLNIADRATCRAPCNAAVVFAGLTINAVSAQLGWW